MSLSLAEYADQLDERGILWPRVPPPVPVKAKPSIRPLPGIRAVLWDVFGTLLRISDGRYTLFPEQDERLHIALEKTIHEFHMWNHMYRKPGPPWQGMLRQYQDYSQRMAMRAPEHRGDLTDVDLIELWQQIIVRLFEKDYTYDESVYGDLWEYSEKVALFFHCSLQGMEPRAHAVRAMTDVSGAGLAQGLLADGPSFSLIHTLRALSQQATLPPLFELLRSDLLIFSGSLGVRKPSPTLYREALAALRPLGITADQVLHVSCRLDTDLRAARELGMKTVLLAAEKSGLEVTSELLNDRNTRPDRLITDLSQLSSVLGLQR